MERLYVSHWLPKIETLGPNKRMAVWFSGCSKNCSGCCAPELQNINNSSECEPTELADFINHKIREFKLDGLTISGGDLLEQNAEAVKKFLNHLETEDILLYTGYDLAEVQNLPIYETLKEKVAVLKCGRYVKALDDGNVLKGSSNQTITYFKEKYRSLYKGYIAAHNRGLQIFFSDNEAIYAGLPANTIIDGI